MNRSGIYDDNKLLSLVANGNEAAFHQLYRLHHQRIYSFAFFLTSSDLLAEEVTQEIFIKIWNHRAELSEIKVFEAWVKTLVRNQCYTFLNRLAKERLIFQNINNQGIQVSSSTEEKYISEEYITLLRQAVDHLSEQQKKVFLFSRIDGMRLDEIAIKMGLSINTVKSHIKAALKNIRLSLGSQALIIFTVFGKNLFKD
ncbi:MAG: RNA polymerase sigma-70 factor [Rikenellaceae bacterium]|nr:RNA polymerase sigma-70 factor [Rikenellaceae bacterium]